MYGGGRRPFLMSSESRLGSYHNVVSVFVLFLSSRMVAFLLFLPLFVSDFCARFSFRKNGFRELVYEAAVLGYSYFYTVTFMFKRSSSIDFLDFRLNITGKQTAGTG